ncbi:MAG: TM2 domain-containing protein [Ruminococcus sp.]|uniref:TM2 domain-containing protein n=1 Tax=Ruminococcus sp. TaxID=41978 RepID=UPI001B08AB12|nr:TM2 domain-containing protein [Ruminococcus sp.]MBO7474186.1 TM2 domain-containing protein [Ruminococcus sp.]
MYSEKNWHTTLLLCLFLGFLGLHRFYVGRTRTGILYLFTFGLIGIGSLVDLIYIISDRFTDGKELPIVNLE